MADSMTGWKIRDAREQIGPGSIVMEDWELKKQLDEGGFGNVWLAEKNIAGIMDQSAIKIIRIPRDPASEIRSMRAEGYSMASIQAEFRQSMEKAVQEIRTMIDLRNHPAVVPCESFDVIQYDEDGSWEIYIRMPLLTSLPDWANNKGIRTEDAIQLGLALSDLLAVCEKKNILHRDIKPANIFVDQENNYRLGDFGLARVISDSNSTHSKGVGTEAFMAPEVFISGNYDHRADLYSLGLVLYWLLNHQSLPFTGNGISRSEANTRRLSGEALPVLSGVDPALERTVRKACDPDPDKRWKTAREFHDALADSLNKPEEIQAHLPTPAKEETKKSGSAPKSVPEKETKAATEKTARNSASAFQEYSTHLLDDGTLCIDSYNGAEKNLIIPEMLDGKKVSGISGKYRKTCFNNDIVSITIPDSVTIIGPVNPFMECYSLKTINVTGNHPDLEVIQGVLFSKADRRLICHPFHSEKPYKVPDGTAGIGDYAFSCHMQLKSVTIPDSVKTIGNHAFRLCESIRSLQIPEGVTSIGVNAFEHMDQIRSISIPASVERIGECAFDGCNNLKAVTVAEGSCAEQYCRENNLKYVYQKEKHTGLAILLSVIALLFFLFIGMELTDITHFVPQLHQRTIVYKGSSKGFGGNVHVTVTFDSENRIESFETDARHETEGLGKRVMDKAYTDQFIGKQLPVKDVEAVSGATVTSNAVIEAVNSINPDETIPEVYGLLYTVLRSVNGCSLKSGILLYVFTSLITISFAALVFFLSYDIKTSGHIPPYAIPMVIASVVFLIDMLLGIRLYFPDGFTVCLICSAACLILTPLVLKIILRLEEKRISRRHEQNSQ